MSRRIIRRSAEILGHQKQFNHLDTLNIRTFANADSLQILCKSSCFVHLVMQKNIKKQMLKICKLAAHRKLAYLTDIQVQDFGMFFVMHKNPIQNAWFHESYANYKDFDLYINPQITKFEQDVIQVEQRCHSFPFLRSIADRSAKITATYTKIDNLQDLSTQVSGIKDVSEQFSGFKAILFQHCMDHLQGKHFFTPQISKGRLILQQSGQCFKNTKFLLKEYNIRIKKSLQQNKLQSPQFKKTENDYQSRIIKSFTTQIPAAEKYYKNFSSMAK